MAFPEHKRFTSDNPERIKVLKRGGQKETETGDAKDQPRGKDETEEKQDDAD